MRMGKKIAAVLAFNVLLSAGNALAEQPAAEKYRAMFQSGTFYVEYGPKGWGMRDYVVAQNGVRMSGYKLEKLFGTTTYPAYRYDNGKYYQFTNKGTVKRQMEIANQNYEAYTHYESYQDSVGIYNTFSNAGRSVSSIGAGGFFGGGVYGGHYELPKKTTGKVLDESQMNNPALDPDEHWELVNSRLSLPSSLKIFAWNDKYMGKEYGETEPSFVESGQVEDDGKFYVCDKYLSPLKDSNGKVKAEMHYTAIYDDKGNLRKITKICRIAGKDIPIDELEIVSITDVLPEKAINMPKSKIYAADTGSITDLSKKQILVEENK